MRGCHTTTSPPSQPRFCQLLLQRSQAPILLTQPCNITLPHTALTEPIIQRSHPREVFACGLVVLATPLGNQPFGLLPVEFYRFTRARLLGGLSNSDWHVVVSIIVASIAG